MMTNDEMVQVLHQSQPNMPLAYWRSMKRTELIDAIKLLRIEQTREVEDQLASMS
jgi:hypothetical protein